MKKNITACICCVTLLFACNEGANKEPSHVANDTGKKSIVTADTKACFSHISGKDTVLLKYTDQNGAVSGDLTYNYFEKDKNTGSISGKFIGDTLLADYTFRSEGIISTREVIFLRSGNTLKEGFGDVKDEQGKMIFKDRSQIKFPAENSLEKSDCAEK